MKKWILLLFLAVSSVHGFEGSASRGKPSVSFLGQPFTRTSSSSAGWSLGLGVTPDMKGSVLDFAFFELQTLLSVPYSKETNQNRNDFVLSLAVFVPWTENQFFGVRGGVTTNFSEVLFPVLFAAGAYRWVFYPSFFFESNLGYSAAGFHYLSLGLGWIFF